MSREIIYISHCNSNPQEGGMARNFAFYNEMKKRGAKIYNYSSKSILVRMYGYLYNILLLLSVKGKKILILQNALSIYVFPISFFRFKAYRTAVGFVIRRISKRNTLYIEVNDLLHEQVRL